MAIKGLTQREMNELKQLMDEYEQRNDTWKTHQDYDRGLMRQMQDELKHYWKFQEWLRFTHPNVIKEFKAIKDIERSANESR